MTTADECLAALRDELRTRAPLGRADCGHSPDMTPNDYLKVANGNGPPRLVIWDETGYRWKVGGQLGTTVGQAAVAVARTLGVPIT